MQNVSFWMSRTQFVELLTYFIAILQWSIGHPSSATIDGDFWLELVVRQMMFSRIPPKQCASRWLWGVHVIFFLAGSIPLRCGKFRFDFFVECVLSNHIFFALSLHLFLTVQFFPTALGWYLFVATKSQEFFFLVVARFDTDVVVFVWWSEDLWASQTCLSISASWLDVIDWIRDKWEITPSNPSLLEGLLSWGAQTHPCPVIPPNARSPEPCQSNPGSTA